MLFRTLVLFDRRVQLASSLRWALSVTVLQMAGMGSQRSAAGSVAVSVQRSG